jgi:hypothetical protein
MKNINTIVGLAAAASFTSASLAGMVSMTVAADSIGSGLYASHTGAKITITMDISDTAMATDNEITSSWSITVVSAGGSTLLSGTGNSSFTVYDLGGANFRMDSALTDGTWTVVDGLTPEPNLIQIAYVGMDTDTLVQAITNSADTADGTLTVGTTGGDDTGALIGIYSVVPAPSALALLAGGLILARRRRA